MAPMAVVVVLVVVLLVTANTIVNFIGATDLMMVRYHQELRAGLTPCRKCADANSEHERGCRATRVTTMVDAIPKPIPPLE